MVLSTHPLAQVKYPDEDGKPMAEGDIQRHYLAYCTEALALYFKSRSDAYVAANLFVYYEEGNPEAVVAPDTFVIFGVGNQLRRSYKTWENGDRTPDFVLEITSRSTRSQDQGAKKGIYAFLGVQEYFQYDPTADYLMPALQRLELRDGNYWPIPAAQLEDGALSIHSSVLGLDLRLQNREFRFFDPATNQKLLAHEELEAARQQAEAARQQAEVARQQVEAQAKQEAEARQQAEARLAELEARLKAFQEGQA